MSGLIAHEWLARHGGSEAIVDAVVDVVHEARVFCLWNDRGNSGGPAAIKESWLSRTPLRGRKAASLPVVPLVWRSIDLRDSDWLFVSSHSMAHQAAVAADRAGLPSLVYVHTPARYLWAPELDPRGSSLGPAVFGPLLRTLDRRRTSPKATYVANSQFISSRIERSWGRHSQVVYPPVDIEGLQSVADWRAVLDPGELAIIDELPTQFILGASRFVSYKRLEDVVRTGELLDIPVVLAGSGPAEAALRSMSATASVPVRFVIDPSNSLLRSLFQAASLYVFPPVEDFGIMPVEAIALGTPALVNRSGGAAETIAATSGGATADFNDGEDLRTSAHRALAADMTDAAAQTRMFGVCEFQKRIKEQCASAGFDLADTLAVE